MKLSGIAGTGSGKLGSQVYAAVSGEQIVRNYQPNVSNPNTSKQVNQRARMKLLSQLSSVYAPVLAFKRKKLVSARNQFVKRNFKLSSGNDGEAQLTYENLQLTAGSAGLPGIQATRGIGLFIDVQFLKDASASVDRVVWCFFKKTAQNKLALVNSIVVEDAGAAGVFPARINNIAGDVLIYAYGMKDLNSKASATYANYIVESGQDVASLLMTRAINYDDYRFTKTRGCTLFSGESSTQSVGPNQSRVFLTASGPGAVVGSGIYENGTDVLLTATPDDHCMFIGWQQNGGSGFVAHSASLQITASSLVDLIAVFQDSGSGTGGLDGEILSNPLPDDTAIVAIDGNRVDVTSGNVILDTSFDEIGINNIGAHRTVVFVPNGSFLGADDNVTFDSQSVQDYEYGYAVAPSNTGAVYIDSLLWFYVITPATQPWRVGEVKIDGTTVDVSSGTVEVEEEAVASMTIENLEFGADFVAIQDNGVRVKPTYRTGVYTFSDLVAPFSLYVNGYKWFWVEVSASSIVISDASINDGNWDGDKTGLSNPISITAGVVGNKSNQKAAIVTKNTKPVLGESLNLLVSLDIQNDSIGFEDLLDISNTPYWLIVYTPNGSDNVSVDYVYDYSFTVGS